jgi:hypothetical protein
MSPVIRTGIIMLIIAAISFGGVLLFHSTELGKFQRKNVVITPDTFAGTDQIELGSIVEITGTPDLLNAVSLEERNTNKVITYYVPLKEYDTNFVIEVKKANLRSEQQTFIGEVNGINKTYFDKRIKNVLNKPVELSDEDRAELDPDTIELLVKDTTKEFPNKALLINDGKVPMVSQLIASLIFWTVIVWTVIATLFRRVVFKDIFF